EGEIVKWLVSAGDQVAEHQPVVEVMTDKATVELPAPAAGRGTEFLAEAGEVVAVGQVICRLETGGDGAAKAQPKQKEQPRQSPPPEPKPTQQGGSKSATPETKAQPKAQSKPEAPKTAPKKAVARSGGGKTVDFKLPDIGEGI